MTWTVLAFTFNDVMGFALDKRLAHQCVKAWRAMGRPCDFDIRRAPGQGIHATVWYVSEAAAQALDAHDAHWRRFQIGFAQTILVETTSALEIDESTR